MRKALPFLFSLLLLAGCSSSAEDASYRQVTMAEAMDIMDTEQDYIILDVRTPEEFRERHIPGAVNVPNESIGAVEPEVLPEKDQLILVYGGSGNRSKQASQKLAAMGYTNVVEFGGINDWPGATVSETEESPA